MQVVVVVGCSCRVAARWALKTTTTVSGTTTPTTRWVGSSLRRAVERSMSVNSITVSLKPSPTSTRPTTTAKRPPRFTPTTQCISETHYQCTRGTPRGELGSAERVLLIYAAASLMATIGLSVRYCRFVAVTTVILKFSPFLHKKPFATEN